MSDWLLITLFVGLPAAFPVVGIWLLRRRAGSSREFVMYRYRLAGSQIAISKDLLFLILSSGLALWWLEYLLPVPLLPILLLYFGFILVANPAARRQANVKSEALMSELSAMQKQFQAANAKVAELVAELETSSAELNQATSVKESLTREIDTKLKEVENWQKLSEEQKQLFIATVGQALRRRTILGVSGVVIGSIALNLAATLIWELMGAPGRDALLLWFRSWTGSSG